MNYWIFRDARQLLLAVKTTWLETFLHANSKHAPKLFKHGKFCMQINQVPIEILVELKDNSYGNDFI